MNRINLDQHSLYALYLGQLFLVSTASPLFLQTQISHEMRPFLMYIHCPLHFSSFSSSKSLKIRAIKTAGRQRAIMWHHMLQIFSFGSWWQAGICVPWMEWRTERGGGGENSGPKKTQRGSLGVFFSICIILMTWQYWNWASITCNLTLACHVSSSSVN